MTGVWLTQRIEAQNGFEEWIVLIGKKDVFHGAKEVGIPRIRLLSIRGPLVQEVSMKKNVYASESRLEVIQTTKRSRIG
jgi:hypothetical protein